MYILGSNLPSWWPPAVPILALGPPFATCKTDCLHLLGREDIFNFQNSPSLAGPLNPREGVRTQIYLQRRHIKTLELEGNFRAIWSYFLAWCCHPSPGASALGQPGDAAGILPVRGLPTSCGPPLLPWADINLHHPGGGRLCDWRALVAISGHGHCPDVCVPHKGVSTHIRLILFEARLGLASYLCSKIGLNLDFFP